MNQQTLRLLYVEDNRADADLLAEILGVGRQGSPIELECEALLERALARLTGETFHALLLDLNLPDSQGLEAIARARRAAPELPILAVAGPHDDELALRAVQAGAQDYLVTGEISPALLERAVHKAMVRKRIDTAQQHRAQELEALYKTSLEINAEMDLATVLSSIMERASQLLEMPMGALYLMESDGQHLRQVVGYKVMHDFVGTVLAPGVGLSGRSAQTGQVLFVEDYRQWENKVTAYSTEAFRRVLAIPMRVGGRVTGVINLIDDQKVGPFSEEEIRLASLFADQAAIVVEKTRMFEAERLKSAELERSNKLIAALSEVVGGMQTTLDTSQVMQIIAEHLARLGVFMQIVEMDNQAGKLVTRFISLDEKQLAQAEEREGIRLAGMHVDDIIDHPPEMITNRRPAFIENVLPMFHSAQPCDSPEGLARVLTSIGISTKAAGIHLPMVVKDRPFGALLLWGIDIREKDVPAYNVFANQVATALENTRLYNEIQKLAIMDELTGLYNRRGFFTLAQQHIHLAQRVKKTVLLVFADIDGMKEINDTLGHNMGDQALIDAANVLRQTYRMADIIARMGGDEFAVLAVVSAAPDTGALNERLVDHLENFNATHPRPYVLSMSIGKSIWTSGKTAVLDSLLTEADARMYADKRTKKEPRA